jgi:hypothetical protein
VAFEVQARGGGRLIELCCSECAAFSDPSSLCIVSVCRKKYSFFTKRSMKKRPRHEGVFYGERMRHQAASGTTSCAACADGAECRIK